LNSYKHDIGKVSFTVCTYKRNFDCRKAHRVHWSLWVDCCRFINRLYQCCFRVGV